MTNEEAPWRPERELKPGEASELVSRQFPALRNSTCRLFGAGWDNTVFLIDERLAFRFPRRELAVELLKFECAVLPAISGSLPLAVPAPTHLGSPTHDFPWPFAGYPLIPGRTADRARLDDAQRTALAPALGRFLRALHDQPPPAGTPEDRRRRVDLSYRVPKVVEQLKAAAEAGWTNDRRPFDELLDAAPVDWTPATDVLVHGDLYSRHLLVDEQTRACGVIDWGDVHRGDPAIDLALAEGLLPPTGRAAFYAAYGDVAPGRRWVARFRALHHALALQAYASDIEDGALLDEARRSLELLAEP